MWAIMPIMALGHILVIWVLPGGMDAKMAATLLSGIIWGIIFLVMGAIMVVPFIRHREISLTNNELRLKLGLLKDNISKYDIISVEPIGETKPHFVFAWKYSLGVMITNVFALKYYLGDYLGVMITKDAKWYVFGGGRTYIKIRRKSGKAVCVGVRNPEEFMTRWRRCNPN